MTDLSSAPFKITLENIETGSVANFFINGIDDFLSQDFFNRKIRDAKTGKEFTIKSSIIEQLDTSR